MSNNAQMDSCIVSVNVVLMIVVTIVSVPEKGTFDKWHFVYSPAVLLIN